MTLSDASLSIDRRGRARERRGSARGDRRADERRTGARHVWFLNGAFDRVTPDQAFARLNDTAHGAPFRFFVTPNVDHLVRLERDPRFAALYARADLTVCDSRVLELLARAAGETVDAAPGADLTERLLADAVDPDEPVVIIGGSRAVVDAVRARYALTDVRWYDAPMGLAHKPEAVADCAAFVAANPARFVFICVGSPQQELVAAACLDRGDCTGVGLCVGASLDFLAGAARRAPLWVRRARLEWLHRLSQEPRRLWRRYLIDGPKVFYLWAVWRHRRARIDRLAQRLIKRRG